MRLADVTFTHTSDVSRTISEHAGSVLKGLLRQAGQATAKVTSTARTIEDQARVMYDVLVGPFNPTTMGAGGATNTTQYSYNLYDNNGDRVVDEYVAGKRAGKSTADILRAMTARIRAIKAVAPTAFKHTADPSVLQVFDLSFKLFANPARFEKVVSANP